MQQQRFVKFVQLRQRIKLRHEFVEFFQQLLMRTKNARAIDPTEAEHLALVKSCPCSVTGAPPPSEAHHIRQGDHFTAIALSWEAHRGPQGIHGDKTLWRVAKMNELAALNVTLRNVARLRAGKSSTTAPPRTQGKPKSRERVGSSLSSSKILRHKYAEVA